MGKITTTSLQQFMRVALCSFAFAAVSANPIITLPPTTANPTMIATTETTKSHYEAIVRETTMLEAQFSPMFDLFKTERMNQSEAVAPDMNIRGFLTVEDDLPTMHERMIMPESELLQKHKLFLQTYVQVMESLKREENGAYAAHSNYYSRDFTSSYDSTKLHIDRLLTRVSELMTFKEIADGTSQNFHGFMAVPHNFQVHNTRSLYVLQNIDEYITNSLFDFNYRLAQVDQSHS